MSRLAAVLILAFALPRDVLADADEMSVHVQVPFGKVTISDPDLKGELFDAMVAGLSGRMTYATSNWWAYELHAGWERMSRLIDGEPFQSSAEYLWRSIGWARVELGVTARLGVDVIPTMHAAIGVQARVYKTWEHIHWQSFKDISCWLEPLVTVGAGLDYRINKHWVIGAMGLRRQTIPIGAPGHSHWLGLVHASFYWYPSQR